MNSAGMSFAVSVEKVVSL